jgi:hypothetical protein
MTELGNAFGVWRSHRHVSSTFDTTSVATGSRFTGTSSLARLYPVAGSDRVQSDAIGPRSPGRYAPGTNCFAPVALITEPVVITECGPPDIHFPLVNIEPLRLSSNGNEFDACTTCNPIQINSAFCGRGSFVVDCFEWHFFTALAVRQTSVCRIAPEHDVSTTRVERVNKDDDCLE